MKDGLRGQHLLDLDKIITADEHWVASPRTCIYEYNIHVIFNRWENMKKRNGDFMGKLCF